MPTLIQLQNRSHETARQKGWWDEYLDGDKLCFPNVPYMVSEKVGLVHSELSEALEDFRVGKMTTSFLDNGKPVGFPTEIADVVIRWMDLFGALKICPSYADSHLSDLGVFSYREWFRSDWFMRQDLSAAKRGDESVIPHAICRAHERVSSSLKTFSEWSPSVCSNTASSVIMDMAAIAWHLDIDLEKEIEIKQSFNDRRTRRHGGKRV